MCFSASISFTTAAVLTVAGVITLKNTSNKKEYILASFPLIFALQQFVEGLSWLYLKDILQGDPPYILLYIFNFCAEVLWPLLAPLGVFLIEPSKRRKIVMSPIIIGGILCSAYLFYCISAGTILISKQNHHIVYSLQHVFIFPYIDYIYLFIVSAAFLISTHRLIKLFGLLLIAAFIVTDIIAYQAYVSVWCFFAAVLSLILCVHFWKSARLNHK
tara:strand:- start:1579 stop:2226 length:648 start_codon:yes stop_codon:yes gene_type:complete